MTKDMNNFCFLNQMGFSLGAVSRTHLYFRCPNPSPIHFCHSYRMLLAVYIAIHTASTNQVIVLYVK